MKDNTFDFRKLINFASTLEFIDPIQSQEFQTYLYLYFYCFRNNTGYMVAKNTVPIHTVLCKFFDVFFLSLHTGTFINITVAVRKECMRMTLSEPNDTVQKFKVGYLCHRRVEI